ncbi:MAG TPA: type II toxin-antitoxin system VapC family toxin [Ignavibacteriaceae bacterium]|nr:type II toxin-antitoxin system VapC family toxin [Ignavibacteriaceae bacterium]
MSKLLLDTNLLIYSIDEGSKYFKQANKIFTQQLELYTTSKNLSEFLSVITRIPKNPLSLKDAILVVEDFRDALTVIYPDENSFKIFIKLLEQYQPVGLHIHDYEIISIALSHKIQTIATFNEKDFEKVNDIELYTFNNVI